MLLCSRCIFQPARSGYLGLDITQRVIDPVGLAPRVSPIVSPELGVHGRINVR